MGTGWDDTARFAEGADQSKLTNVRAMQNAFPHELKKPYYRNRSALTEMMTVLRLSCSSRSMCRR